MGGIANIIKPIFKPIREITDEIGITNKPSRPASVPAPPPLMASGGTGGVSEEVADPTDEEGATFSKKNKLRKGTRALKIPTSTGGGGNVGV